MFVKTMKNQDLVREYQLDLPEIEANNARIDESSYTSKILIKFKKQDKVCFTKYYTTSRNNKYINVFIYSKSPESTKKAIRWDWKVISFGLMVDYKGTCAIGFFSNAQLAIVFQSHFFLRYKERYAKICDWQTKNAFNKTQSVEDVIKLYIKRNPQLTWVDTPVKYKEQNHAFAPINDGVALIQWDDDIVQANTFITNDMLSEKQRDMVEQAECEKQYQEEKEKLFQKLYSIMNN